MQFGRLERWLGSPRFPWVAALVAFVLGLPALGNGFLLDDHFLRLISLRLWSPPGLHATPWDLFHFGSGRLEDFRSNLDVGIAPWWMPQELVLGFFRPLASASHHLDFLLFPGAPALMHLENLLWFSASVVLAGTLYRRFERVPWIAGLASFVFAVSGAHSTPVGWIANRNSLMALAFVLGALICHDRWRRDGWRAGAVSSPLLFALGFLSGEIALSGFGFVLAHALCFERGVKRRLLAVSPVFGVIVVWRAGYVLAGYGARASGLYIDPLVMPRHFVEVLPERFALLAASALAGVPSDLWAFTPRSFVLGLVALSVMALALIGWGLARLLRSDPLARFWALGAGFALIPVVATIPNDRLVLLAGIGTSGLIARAIHAAGAGAVVPRALGIFFVSFHLVAAPLALPFRIRAVRTIGVGELASARALGPEVEGRTLVVVAVPDTLLCIHLLTYGASLGRPMPKHVRCLAITAAPFQAERPSEKELILRGNPEFFTGAMDSLIRAEEVGWRAGETVQMSALSVRVEALGPSGRPSALRVVFDSTPDSDAYRFVTWCERGFVPFKPPAIGTSVSVPATETYRLLIPE